jgi:hypothetical protein
MGQNSNFNFSNFQSQSGNKDAFISKQEWIAFLKTLNQKLNLLYSLSGIDYNVVVFSQLPTNLTGPAWGYTQSDGNFWAWNNLTQSWQKVAFVLS